MTNKEMFDFFQELGIVPVVKIDDADKAEKLAQAMVKGGIPCAEITFRTDAAEESIRRISQAFPEMLVGAGTVLNTETAKRAVAAGAKFIVSPGLDEDTVRWCQANDIPVVPGVSSASEIQKGINMGLSVLKFFPAEANGGVKMIKDLGGPFPQVKFMTTGGINTSNLSDYARTANILAVGGSWMVKADLINGEKWEEIEALCREAVTALQGFEFAHVGINSNSEDEARGCVSKFAQLGMAVKEGNSSIFMDTDIEVIKKMGRGKNGHLCYRVNNTRRAMAYLKAIGYTIAESSIQLDAKGNVKNFYVEEELNGFAVHFLQK